MARNTVVKTGYKSLPLNFAVYSIDKCYMKGQTTLGKHKFNNNQLLVQKYNCKDQKSDTNDTIP